MDSDALEPHPPDLQTLEPAPSEPELLLVYLAFLAVAVAVVWFWGSVVLRLTDALPDDRVGSVTDR
ncbi:MULTISPECIES: hypothetical protein [Halorussus]|uniref:hypothetical protein n=1 Tax=Halorussus TaxID=1070314 RepID=UPI000E218E02|nr:MULTISPECIES: hypothetical protein [Halorussus]NHN58023.1 hypothetical protein [Halorussus sp. JP-T4]